MEYKILENLGLTKNEIRVYVNLIESGSKLAGEITESTGIHRRNVYDCLERLIQKGLVSYVNINNKRWFSPANPNRFLEIIEEKKSELDENKKEIRKLMPYFMDMRKSKLKQDVRFFRGIEGLKTVYEDILRTRKNYIGYGPGKKVEELLRFYFPYYIKKRQKTKIFSRLIYEESSRERYYVKAPLSKVKFLPDSYISLTSNRVYGDKVAILLISKEEPLAIIIKNKSIALSYRKYFELLWKIARV